MCAPCGLVMTRSAMYRPAVRISSSVVSMSSCMICRIPIPFRAGSRRPVENNLAALTAAGDLKRRLEVTGREAMGDGRLDIEALRHQHRHGIPGLEHFPAVDAGQRQRVDHERTEVESDHLARQS